MREERDEESWIYEKSKQKSHAARRIEPRESKSIHTNSFCETDETCFYLKNEYDGALQWQKERVYHGN